MTDKKDQKTNGYFATISFVPSQTVQGFVEAQSEEEAMEKFQSDFSDCHHVQISKLVEMDEETAKSIIQGPQTNQPKTLQ